MKLTSIIKGLALLLFLAGTARAQAQNFTITLYDGQNGTGNPILSYNGPMLTPLPNWTQIGGFVVFNPAPLPWTTPPITADLQPGVLNPCNAALGNGGPNGEAAITCESSNNSNGLPLFSFCFLGAQWPIPVGAYNVDTANQRSCGNYFYASSQLSGYASYAFLNNGSIVVVKNKTWTVTSLADDGSLGTLRYAIANANSGDTINFAVQGTITLAQGQLEISKVLTISGPGAANLSISGNNTSRVFQIDSGAAATISGVTVQQGAGGINGREILNNGILNVSNCTVLVNTYNSNNAQGNGGGLYNAGTATITNCTFVGSLYFGVAGDGGGLYNAGTATVTGSTFLNFGISGYGAGIYNAGTATVTNSTFWQNGANVGGAMFNYNGATLTVVNSTLAGNQGGPAIYNLNSTTTLKNTLMANSPGGNCYVNGGSITSGGYNLSDDTSCSAYLTQTGDVNNTPAGLDHRGLQNNGGPTQTVAILPTSPAFNVIPLSPTNHCTATDGTTPIATDQRGVSRPQVSACDIGAFEYSSDDDSGLAQLAGGNNLSGNQNVNGVMTATSFVGNGSGLTGVNAQTAATAFGLSCTGCVGNSQLTINYAAGDAQGGNALNALMLGGFLPGAFAPASGSPNYAAASGSTSYVSKTGDTMSGALNLPANGLVAGTSQFVLAGGNVGIGSTSPANNLSVGGTADFAGNVGVGTATPGLGVTSGTNYQLTQNNILLHVKGTNAFPNARVTIEGGTPWLDWFNDAGGSNAKWLAFWNHNGIGEFRSLTDSAGSQRDAILAMNLSSGNVGIGTASPAATLEVNGTAQFDNTVTFASGQTFPGTGTITGVTAGSGLSGGGTNGSVTLSVDATVARTNASNTFSGPQTVSGGMTATSFSGSGAGLTNLPAANLTGAISDANLPSDVARLATPNSFTGPQSISINSNSQNALAVSNPSGNGVVASGNFSGVVGSSSNVNGAGVQGSNGAGGNGVLGQSSGAAAVYGLNLSASTCFSCGLGVLGNSANGTGVYGTGGIGVYGAGTKYSIYGFSNTASGIAGLFSVGNGAKIVSGQNNSTEVFSVANNGALTIGGGTPIASGIAGAFNVASGAKIISGQNNGSEVFSVASGGNVSTSGSLSTSGALTIGTGGTPIVEYVSTTYSATLPALTSGSCTTFTTAALTGFTPGSSDSIALGIPKSLVSSLGSSIFLIYQAWETATTTSPTITIQVCNPTGSRYAGGATGTIRVDVFKH